MTNKRRIEYLKTALTWWADWVKSGKTWPNTLGYPQATVEWRMMRGEAAGGARGKSKVPHRINWDQEVLDIDRALNKMPEQWFVVVNGTYVGGLSSRKLAKIIETTPTEIHFRLREALAWLDGRLSP